MTPSGNLGVLHPSHILHKSLLPKLSQMTLFQVEPICSLYRGSFMTNLLITRLPSFKLSFFFSERKGLLSKVSLYFASHFILSHISLHYLSSPFLASSISISLMALPFKSANKLQFSYPGMTKQTNSPLLDQSPQIHLLEKEFQ